jgi:predicted negative regulator of RcsB-dependent stress response
MKRSERHRLKENELSHAFTEATNRFAERQRTYGTAGAIVLVVALAAGGYWAWHTRNETRAQVLLTEALMVVQSPVEAPKPDADGKVVQLPGSYPTINARAEAALQKFVQVGDQYPSTKAGIASRYYAAAALSMLGRPGEAVTRFQDVVNRAGASNFYGRMAQLGTIEAQVQAKQYDQAIAGAQALANSTDDSLPRDAALMELGRAYAAAGKKTEAKQTFDKVVTEFPESAFADEAKAAIAPQT